MKQCCLSSVVETEEKKFGVLIEKTKGCKNIVDCEMPPSVLYTRQDIPCANYIHQLIIHILF